jgi:predicted nucleic acid-binding protein
MTSPDQRPFLPDVNVWIALASNRPEHHSVARIWFEAVAGAQAHLPHAVYFDPVEVNLEGDVVWLG